ncbi:1-phosphofructokinase family hexose kinase [Actinophytocola oryzae]|uniref:Tagatose 6-phosphate kinase n=1 Tax=Actinophytocola oryzae TaxID=502181 RepID=A0A4V3FQ26_9PSEU|nr:1-phosphofructokinase family hexose kinase [Actinophytocola oryzae]TDV34911.1 tagatose 6-phosphate kinase [Actinophytocola oryzae]
MILTVTLNAALDVTYQVPTLRLGETHRPTAVDVRAGGKGLNVARVLHALGHETMVTGLVGGDTGAAIRADVRVSGLRESLFDMAGPSRRTVTIVSDGTATAVNEPGPPVSISDWADFLGGYHALAARASFVVLSGSLPGNLPDDAYAQLVRATGTPTILDASGGPLLEGLAARPSVVKPNAAELAETTGLSDPVAAARVLLGRGAGAVVASLGADGLVAVTERGSWRVRVPEALSGNPTGAGDACVAALAAGHALDWPTRLAEAVAVSAAAVPCPLAGDIDQATYARLRPAITVEELDAHANR